MADLGSPRVKSKPEIKRGLSSNLRLNADSWTWSSIGQLNSARANHGVILVQNTFMVVGGFYNDGNTFTWLQPNEACFLVQKQLHAKNKIAVYMITVTQYYYSSSMTTMEIAKIKKSSCVYLDNLWFIL